MSLNPHLITIASVLAADGHSASARDLRRALPPFSRRNEILQELTDQQWIIPTVADRYTLNDDRPGMDALKELLATTADTPAPPATADRHLSTTEQQQQHRQHSVIAAADAKTLPFIPEPDDAPTLLTQELRQRRRRIYRSMALPNQLEHQYQLLYSDLRHERGRDFIHLLGRLEEELSSLPAEHPDPPARARPPDPDRRPQRRRLRPLRRPSERGRPPGPRALAGRRRPGPVGHRAARSQPHPGDAGPALGARQDHGGPAAS